MLCLTVPALADDEEYKLGPDSMHQDSVPQGTVTKDIWHSKVFPERETVRDYWGSCFRRCYGSFGWRFAAQ